MKKFWDKLKRIYEAYKTAAFFIGILGWGADRFVNFWNVPSRLDKYEVSSSAQRKKDSLQAINYISRIEYLEKAHKNDSLQSLKNAQNLHQIKGKLKML